MRTCMITLLCLLMSAGHAQENTGTGEKKTMGGGGFTIGYGFMDVSKLQAFVPAGTPAFKNNFVVIGGTGHGFINKFVIGGGGFGITNNMVRTDSLKADMGGGLGTFDIGYLLVDRKKLKIYPLLGIGGGGFGLRVARSGNVSADHLSGNPSREISIDQGYLVTDVSLNINLVPALQYNEKDNTHGGFMTGLKIGYVYSLPSNNWSFSGGDITGGPDFGFNLFYVKLIVGGFGY